MNETASSSDRPVFFDPEQRRWPLVRRLLLVGGTTLAVLLALLFVTIVLQPALPALGLHGGLARRVSRTAPRPLDASRRRARITPVMLMGPPAPPRLLHRSKQEPLRFGFYVNWDPGSLTSLAANIEKLDVLVPEWLHVTGATPKLAPDAPYEQRELVEFLRQQQQRHAVRLMPIVDNWNPRTERWDGDMIAALSDAGTRHRLVRQLAMYVRATPLATGLDVNLEEIPPASGPAVDAFVAELGRALHAERMQIAVTVPADRPAGGYAQLSKAVDFVILELYDQHWPEAEAGPLAAVGWFQEILQLRAQDVPPEKMVLGLGSYAYDWPDGSTAATLTFDEAMLEARQHNARITLDPQSLTSTFRYQDDEGHGHQVWVLDAASLFDQLVTAQQFAPRGYALWRLGSEDPGVWRVLTRHGTFDARTAEALRDITFRYRVDHVGDGEVFQVQQTPQPGRRLLGYDAQRGLITSERFAQLPAPFVVRHYGAPERKIALTFDDGPDPKYTKQVLEVLEKKHAPATFFVIGENAQANPGLLRREVEEGNEVGNHTFTHPILSKISARQLKVEVAATERAIESALERQTLLFRPPYAEYDDPTTPDAIGHLTGVNQLGYFVVGEKLDTNDWQKPGVESIVHEALAKAELGMGHVVLMHDGGGDRSQTVQALPRIIDGLRARGFQLVTVSDLLGTTHEAMMPPLSGRRFAIAWFDRCVFALLNFGRMALVVIFVAGIVLGVARLFFVGALALVDGRRRKSERALAAVRHAAAFEGAPLPSVAVIIPAYNEEKVIVDSVRSLLLSEYGGALEIVVVDDGSKDRTLQNLRGAFDTEPRVRVFTKENGGKAAALNFGIQQTRADVLVALDADTLFLPDTIAKLVRHFADPQVGAVAGNAKVGNRINVLTRWQALEYVTSQNLERRAFHVLNGITVVPGAVGAWRRELVERLGGFTHLTLAEDADLTISILRLGFRVLYEDEAVALTEAPDTIRGFLQQRFRWMFGTLQAAWKHRDCLLDRKYGALGLLALPNVIVFQVLFALLSPIMDGMLLVALVETLLTSWQHSAEVSNQALLHTLVYYALFTLVDFTAAAIAFALERDEDRSLLLWLFPQRFLYRQLLYFVAIKSTFAALRGSNVGWNKVQRKATVQLAPAPVVDQTAA